LRAQGCLTLSPRCAAGVPSTPACGRRWLLKAVGSCVGSCVGGRAAPLTRGAGMWRGGRGGLGAGVGAAAYLPLQQRPRDELRGGQQAARAAGQHLHLQTILRAHGGGEGVAHDDVRTNACQRTG
jgi:hypothetical protein